MKIKPLTGQHVSKNTLLRYLDTSAMNRLTINVCKKYNVCMVSEYAQWMLLKHDEKHKQKCVDSTVAKLRAQGFHATPSQVEFAMDFKDSQWPSANKVDFGFRVTPRPFVSEAESKMQKPE